MKRILIVEDDLALSQGIALALQNENVKIEQNLCQGAEYPGRKTAFSYWIAGKGFQAGSRSFCFGT
ncbi:MAG: hypothetical protein PHC41_10665 [Lachnospiraceae bacterium]|nr:hypothetical protein [Lachnospiraceae bacterium]MDD3616670.1 hypothetical protein [Lachnospiraceae bacterium]